MNGEKQEEIEKEEKMRAEAKAKAEKEIREKEKKKKQKQTGIGCLVVLGLIIFFIAIISIGGGGENQKAETTPSTIDLNASVNFTGEQFVIANEDNFDWTDVKLEVNSGLLKGGYVLRTKKMIAGETYTVGALQFAKGDGTKLNPFAVKPLNFSIWCDTPKGKGFWYGSWE